jgi:hypothetical protein
MHTILPQGQYQMFREQTKEWIKKSWKTSQDAAELTKIQSFKLNPEHPPLGKRDESGLIPKYVAESFDRNQMAHKLIKSMVGEFHGPDGMKKAGGVTSSLGYNFYDLRAPVELSYPVNVPFRNSLPRIGRVNDGYGVAAHWQATRNPGILYAGVSEGQRAATATPDDNAYIATYKELGVERAVTFTAEFAGEGYADNLADEHLRGLHELWLQEEGLMLLGNSGTSTGNNGFQLGTAATPTLVATAATAAYPAASAGFPAATNVSVACVYLTGMGNPANAQYGYGTFPTVANGLTPTYQRTNADGSKNTINGGISVISAMSTVVATSSGNRNITASVPVGTKGVFGYAWYVDIADASTGNVANAYLYAITQFPTVVINGAPAGTQNGSALGTTDYSAQPLDFDGLLTYVASTPGATWTDLGGASLTSSKNGRVVEIETILQSIFTQYQAGIDAIWGSADAVTALDQAVRYSGTGASGFQFITTRDGQGNLLGGFLVSGYQSRYAVANPTGANVISIHIHPMIPPGTLFFDCATNPYPHSRAPFTRGMLVQRDYYSIEWPIVTRNWTFGTYVHEVLAHHFPWISAVLTGIGPFVGN